MRRMDIPASPVSGCRAPRGCSIATVQSKRFPPDVLGEQREDALLFKKLATLRTDAPLFRNVDELEWRGPTAAFAAWTERIEAPRLLERCRSVEAARNNASEGAVGTKKAVAAGRRIADALSLQALGLVVGRIYICLMSVS